MEINEERIVDINDFFDIAENEGGIYEVETPQGWVEIGSLVKKYNKECFLIRTKNGLELGGSGDHYVETDNGWENLKELDVNSCYVNTKNGKEEVVAKEYLGIRDTFDIEVKNDDHKYYSNDIVSHNTGKTTIAFIACKYCPNNTVLWITPETLVENSNRAKSSIKTLYRLADYVSPCIVILEDLDLIGQDRDSGGDTMLLGALMNILDGVNSIDDSVTIATTNRLSSLEKALRNRPGRFDRVIEVPSMETDLRKKMLTSRLDDWKKEDGIVDYLVDKTEGWTPAEIQEFINSSHLKFIGSKKKIKHMNQEWAESIIETMQKFGVGSSVSSFGFNKKND